MKVPQKDYFLYTWGGFYNKHNQELHHQQEGLHVFDNEVGRETYLETLQKFRDTIKTSDCILIYKKFEGYNVQLPCIHRISEYKGKKYYSKYCWNWLESLNVLKYVAKYKWYPGHNDEIIEEQLGEKVDYSKVKIIDEWFTGTFLNKEI